MTPEGEVVTIMRAEGGAKISMMPEGGADPTERAKVCLHRACGWNDIDSRAGGESDIPSKVRGRSNVQHGLTFVAEQLGAAAS